MTLTAMGAERGTTEGSMRGSRDYAAVMDCRTGGRWLPDAEAQIAGWLREKNYDVSLGESADYDRDGSLLSIRRHSGGDVDDLRISLLEHGDATGTWHTELLAHDAVDDGGWIQLNVRNDQGRFVAVPRLAGYLIESLALRDGRIEFTATPRILRTTQVDELVALLADDRRHGLVFVAGTDENLSFDQYVRMVAKWSKEICGLGQILVLDPPSTRAFAERVGDRYAAPAWSIRTYGPGVDFADPSAARRHRILGTTRLAQSPDAATRRLLGDIVRQQAATRPADPRVRQVRRRLERLENRRLVEAIGAPRTAPPVPPPPQVPAARPAPLHIEPTTPPAGEADPAAIREAEAERSAEQLALVRQVLGITEITEEALRVALDRAVDRTLVRALEQRVDELQHRTEQLEDDSQYLREALDEAEMEAELARLDVDQRDGRIRWLESRLRAQGDYESAYLEPPAEFGEDRPNDFGELLDRIEAIDGVTFTGDLTEALKLDQIDTNGTALRTAWDAVRTLAGYVDARKTGDCARGLDWHINNPGDHKTVPKNKWGNAESAMTMKTHGAERIFPVPERVDPSRWATMRAHFKLANIGMTSPRMYIYDGHPDVPEVFIGYIGPHLTNMQTN